MTRTKKKTRKDAHVAFSPEVWAHLERIGSQCGYGSAARTIQILVIEALRARQESEVAS